MLFQASTVALITCGIALVSVAGNRIGLWNSWLMCAAGAFTFVLVLNLATPISGFASGFLMAGLTALLRFVGDEHTEFVAPKKVAYASEQPRVEDVFEFQEVVS